MNCRKFAELVVVATIFSASVPCLAEGEREFAIASQYCRLGRYDAAIPYLKQTISLDPDNMMAHYLLANSYVHTSQHQQAQQEYRQCLKMSPDSSVAQYCRDALETYKHPPKPEVPARYSRFSVDQEKTNEEQRAQAIAKFNSQVHEQKMRSEADEHMMEQRLKDAKAEAEKIRQQGRDEANAVPWMRRGGYYRRIEQDLIKQESEARAKEKETWAQRQSDAYQSSAAERSSILNDAQNGLQSQIQSSGGRGNVKLNPVGTNLYIRNYSQSK